MTACTRHASAVARYAIRLCALWATLCGGCAKRVPEGRHGVERLRIRGTDAVREPAIKERIATRARDAWAFWWEPWPLYDESVFERDRERIERYYRARGYYDARVTQVQRVFDDSARRVSLEVVVSEGPPVRIRSVRVTGLSAVPAALERKVQRAVTLRAGERFDETAYDQAKEAVQRALGNAAYAQARVTGRVELDPKARTADVLFHASPGQPCRFGRITVEGNGDLPARPIYGASGLRSGRPYSVEALEDARMGVYGLGAFASVETATTIDAERNVVDVRIVVVPGRRFRFGIGAGVEVGGPLSQESADVGGTNFAQWDVHLLGRIEHRNFLGGMRRLRVEERPRLIFDDPFPSTQDLHFGNAIQVDLEQPAFMEPRTTLAAHARWDLGPDPFGGQFFRSDLVLGIGPERRFWKGRLLLSSTLNANYFLPDPFGTASANTTSPIPSYLVTFLQHRAQLELRDNPRRPTSGSYFSATVQHAGYILRSDWDYVRITPEARGYLPLPLGMVLAGRARLGMLFVTETRIAVPRQGDENGFIERLALLGPLRQRLRGGGANSVRGYVANTLGDVVLVDGRLDSGGLRQWEASLELRVPFTENFGSVLFADAGDVTRDKHFRFDHPQTTLGFGLRYHTLVGPLRFDVGFAPPSLQTFGPDDRIRDGVPTSRIPLLDVPGNLQLTIGEAF